MLDMYEYNYSLSYDKDKIMKQFLLFFLLLSALHAEVTHQYIDLKLINSNTPIVDIRTPGEWKETGLVKGSIPIMFFDERGGYNLETFLKQLNQNVDTTKRFAMICNSGSRTRIVADYLAKKYGYSIINLQGGIRYGMGKRVPLEPYKAQ